MHVPVALAAKVEKLSERLKRSRGWIIERALTAWIAQEKERHRMTLQGLADVDAACVIDHQAVQDWADSLATEKPRPLPR